MKPVDQTTFGFPGGNCFSACVASLLEIPIDDVPYFMGDSLDDDGGDPHPERSGLGSRDDVCLLIPLDPGARS